MPENSKSEELGEAWRNQPAEKVPVDPTQFVSRRTRELSRSTRAEIAIGIGAAVFFVATLALRFAAAGDRIPHLGSVTAIAALVWALICVYWFRDRIWRKVPSRAGALAEACREYYRKELEQRRDHLRNEWLWHGPLFLACLISAAIFIGRGFPGFAQLRNAAPLVAMLAVWTGVGIRRRRRQANEIQREIDEIDRP